MDIQYVNIFNVVQYVESRGANHVTYVKKNDYKTKT